MPLAQRFKTSPPRRCGRLHPLLRGLNPHLHFHCVVVDGVFEAGADVDLPVRFHEASTVSPEWLNGIHAQVRQRLLRAFTCRGLLEADAARESPGNTAVDSASMPAHRSQRPIRLGAPAALLRPPGFRARTAAPDRRRASGLRKHQIGPRGQCRPTPDAARTDRETGRADPAATSASASLLRRAGPERAATGGGDWRSSGSRAGRGRAQHPCRHSTAGPRVTSGHSCWRASTRYCRWYARSAAARCGSSPSSPKAR